MVTSISYLNLDGSFHLFTSIYEPLTLFFPTVAMLALVSLICIYGTLASLINFMFSQRVLPMGPPLFKVITLMTKCFIH